MKMKMKKPCCIYYHIVKCLFYFTAQCDFSYHYFSLHNKYREAPMNVSMIKQAHIPFTICIDHI